MSIEVEQVTTAIAQMDLVQAGIAEMDRRYRGMVYDCATVKGMAEARAHRAAYRTARLEVESIRKGAKAPLLEIGRKIDAAAKDIVARLEPGELEADAQIKAEEDRKEAERQSRIAAEVARQAAITAKVTAMSGLPAKHARSSSAVVAEALATLAAQVLTAEDFMERLSEAEAAKSAALHELRIIGEQALAHEDEQARLAAEREELNRLREEQRQRDAENQAKVAAERAALEAQRAAQEAERKAEEKRLADERAAQKAEQDRIEAANRAEQARIAAEREALAQLQREEVERMAKAERSSALVPTATDLVNVVAEAYSVTFDTAADWLRNTNFTEV